MYLDKARYSAVTTTVKTVSAQALTRYHSEISEMERRSGMHNVDDHYYSINYFVVPYLKPTKQQMSPARNSRRGSATFYSFGLPRPPQSGRGMWSIASHLYSGTDIKT